MSKSLPRATILLLLLITLAGLIPRYYRLDKPLLIFHAWRQCDTAAIARNIYRNGFDFLHPRIDYRGNGANIAETECQIYGLIVAVFYGLLGEKEAIGRTVTLLFYLATILPLLWLSFHIAGRYSLPFCLFFFLATPMSVVMSTAFQPDAMMLCFLVYSIALFWQYLHSKKPSFGVAASITLALALLVKLSAAHVGIVFLGLSLAYYGLSFIKEVRLWAIAVISLLPACAWYSYASSFPVSFQLWTLGPHRLENWFGWYSSVYVKAFAHHMMGFTLTELVFGLGLIGFIGLLSTTTGKKRALVISWAVALLFYLALTSKHMIRHSYYCLPALPLFALLASWVPAALLRLIEERKQQYFLPATMILFALIGSWIINRSYGALYPHMYVLNDKPKRLLLLAEMIKERTKPDDLIVTATGHGRPELLYYANRKGWHIAFEKATREAVLSLYRQGARWFAILQPNHPQGIVKENDLRTVAPLINRFHKGNYNLNYCAGEGYGFFTVLPIGLWLEKGKGIGTGNFTYDVFQDIRTCIKEGKNIDAMATVLGLNAFLLPKPIPNEQHFLAVPKLLVSPSWRLIHFEDAGFIYLFAGGKSKKRALKEAYEYIDPLNRYGNFSRSPNPSRQIYERCYDEARRAHEKSRSSINCALVLGFMCFQLGRFDEGYQLMSSDDLIKVAPKTCYVNLAIFAYRAKRYDLARKHIQEILSLFGENQQARTLLQVINKEDPPK